MRWVILFKARGVKYFNRHLLSAASLLLNSQERRKILSERSHLADCASRARTRALSYLREVALVIEDAQYPMRLCCDEVEAGLVMAVGLLLPLDLLPHVLLLHTARESLVPR